MVDGIANCVRVPIVAPPATRASTTSARWSSCPRPRPGRAAVRHQVDGRRTGRPAVALASAQQVGAGGLVAATTFRDRYRGRLDCGEDRWCWKPHRSSTEDGRVGRAVTAGEGGRIPVPIRGRPPGYRARWPWPTPARRDGLRMRNRGTLSIFAPAKLGDRSRPGAGISATHTRSDVRQKCYPGGRWDLRTRCAFSGKIG
jgi:hypothetical protein